MCPESQGLRTELTHPQPPPTPILISVTRDPQVKPLLFSFCVPTPTGPQGGPFLGLAAASNGTGSSEVKRQQSRRRGQG